MRQRRHGRGGRVKHILAGECSGGACGRAEDAVQQEKVLKQDGDLAAGRRSQQEPILQQGRMNGGSGGRGGAGTGPGRGGGSQQE